MLQVEDVIFTWTSRGVLNDTIRRIFLNFSLCLEIMDKWKEIKLKIFPEFVFCVSWQDN